MKKWISTAKELRPPRPTTKRMDCEFCHTTYDGPARQGLKWRSRFCTVKCAIKATTTPNGDCWDWTGPIANKKEGRHYNQRGLMTWPEGKSNDERNHKVHSYVHAYHAWYGEPASGLVIDHTCNRPICCNPAHLEAVTQTENMARIARRKEEVCRLQLTRTGSENMPLNLRNIHHSLKEAGVDISILGIKAAQDQVNGLIEDIAFCMALTNMAHGDAESVTDKNGARFPQRHFR